MLSAWLLPGCPLSDNYFIDPSAGQAGAVAMAGVAGIGPTTDGGAAGMAGRAGGMEMAGRSGATAGGMSGSSAGSGGTGGTQSAGCTDAELCDGKDNDCNGETDEGSVCPDGCQAQTHDGHLYLLCVSSAEAIAADDASARCGDYGAQLALTQDFGLAWIESADENDFLKGWVKATAPDGGVIWMAANDQATEGTWVWGRRASAEEFFVQDGNGTGEPYLDRFNDWGDGQPGGSRGIDEDCGAFDARVDWQWSDRGCDEALAGFVCEEHPPE